MSCHKITKDGKPVGVLCTGSFSVPTETKECREVIWSSGTSCRKCHVTECYRQGWPEPAVRADNEKIVAANMAALKEVEK